MKQSETQQEKNLLKLKQMYVLGTDLPAGLFLGLPACLAESLLPRDPLDEIEEIEPVVGREIFGFRRRSPFV